MNTENAVVAVYNTHGESEEADENVVGYYNTGDRMKRWGKVGAFWGGFRGLLFGSAFFAIPGIGWPGRLLPGSQGHWRELCWWAGWARWAPACTASVFPKTASWITELR